MNKKGDIGTYFFVFMIAIVCFVFGYAIAPALTQTSNESQHNSLLNCSSPTLTVPEKTSCTQQDIAPSFFVGLCFALAGLVIAGAYKYG